MKKIILSIFAIAMLLASCSKEEIKTVKDHIPEGWDAQDQIVIIEGQGYNMTSISNEETGQVKYLDEPKEMTEFFEKYDETFVPHVVLDKEGLKVFFYKDWDDFLSNVTMEVNEEEDISNKASNLKGTGVSISYHHRGPSGTTFGQGLNTFKGFDFGNASGWGQSNSWVGSSHNDKFSEVRLISFSSPNTDLPMHYMGCEHSNWGGRKVILTMYNITPGSIYHTFDLHNIPFTRIGYRSWHDRISSCETWKASYYISHWNNPDNI